MGTMAVTTYPLANRLRRNSDSTPYVSLRYEILVAATDRHPVNSL